MYNYEVINEVTKIWIWVGNNVHQNISRENSMALPQNNFCVFSQFVS